MTLEAAAAAVLVGGMLSEDPAEARVFLLEVFAVLRSSYRECFGEDLVSPAPPALLDEAAVELAQATSAWAWERDRASGAADDTGRVYDPDVRAYVSMLEERVARCGELAHDLGQAWLRAETTA